MQRCYQMAFGAQPQGGGWVRFGLWAPAAQVVEIGIDDGVNIRRERLTASGQGWFGVTTQAAAGDRYGYWIDGSPRAIPDPASRFQPQDVHGWSEVIAAAAWDWTDQQWVGRPWEDAVIYELHVGSFSPAGTFAGVREHLRRLADLGITAIELMPVADFPGRRNWGYDGVLPFAPDSRYGRPEDLKELIQSAHHHGLMVFLDVVYNHFGPEGNYLHGIAPQFFSDRHATPWGAGINFDGLGSEGVRRYFIDNALFWLCEYNFDGLRLDAAHAMADDSQTHILKELADRVRTSAVLARPVHLILENEQNAARWLARGESGLPPLYTAQWNDDVHHALHVALTNETGGYYEDYAIDPHDLLGRALTEGFAYQGESSRYRHGAPRGEPSGALPPQAFINFLQNHDQIGNRARGERIDDLAPPAAVRAAVSLILLAPSPPMLFMGQEMGSRQPFPFFCDFGGELAAAVTDGRRREFSRFPEFASHQGQAGIPDPINDGTFAAACLDWAQGARAPGRDWVEFYRHLLFLRRQYVRPHLDRHILRDRGYERVGGQGLRLWWEFADGQRLAAVVNLGPNVIPGLHARVTAPFLTIPGAIDLQADLPPWAVVWSVHRTAR